MKKFIIAALMLLNACMAAYPAELALCNQQAITLCESIECENVARKSRGRPLRELPPECAKDAGHE